jgi:ubiquinone/menaquinone biosynthesis C-methylase UbiE
MSDDETRAAVLAETRAVYEEYAASGRTERWTGREAGSRIARAERDAWILAAVGSASARRVLDLGCGDGHLARLLDDDAHRPASYLGVDLLEERLAEARTDAPVWASFEVASADALPIDAGGIDVVVAMTLLSSVPDPSFRARIAAEIDRVLAPGGRFVVYDFRYPSPSNPHVRPVTPDDLRRLFPGWTLDVTTMTVLPPLARRRVAGGTRRYRLLHLLPPLRSHIGAVLVRP